MGKTTDNGFALWKRKKGQRMYTSTELYCTKTFGGDSKKLRRYLVAKGGFGDDEIRSIRVFQFQDRETQKMVHHARVVVNGRCMPSRTRLKHWRNREEGKRGRMSFGLAR